MHVYVACAHDRNGHCEHCGSVDRDNLYVSLEVPWSNDAVLHCRQWYTPTWAAQVLEGQTMLTCHVALQCMLDVLTVLGFARSPVERAVMPWIRDQRAARAAQMSALDPRTAAWYNFLARRFRLACSGGSTQFIIE